jgi:putative transcriptional regulator
MSAGTKLLKARKKIGWTQEELAERTGITRAYLSNLESGKYSPSLKVAKKLAKSLRLTLDELF